MKSNIFMIEEFLEKVSITKAELSLWEGQKLIEPSGYTDDRIPCYSEETIAKVTHIKQFLELGYGLDEIQKIIRKIGLPRAGKKSDKTAAGGKYLTVGNLAERVGISPRTIKHWEDKGIIEPNMRSEGGFRLYSEDFIYYCQLIRDLQLFGYTLEEIHEISIHFNEFVEIDRDVTAYSYPEVERKIETWQMKIQILFDKTALLKDGIQRWEDLMKKKKKEISAIKSQNQKRLETQKGEKKK